MATTITITIEKINESTAKVGARLGGAGVGELIAAAATLIDAAGRKFVLRDCYCESCTRHGVLLRDLKTRLIAYEGAPSSEVSVRH